MTKTGGLPSELGDRVRLALEQVEATQTDHDTARSALQKRDAHGPRRMLDAVNESQGALHLDKDWQRQFVQGLDQDLAGTDGLEQASRQSLADQFAEVGALLGAIRGQIETARDVGDIDASLFVYDPPPVDGEAPWQDLSSIDFHLKSLEEDPGPGALSKLNKPLAFQEDRLVQAMLLMACHQRLETRPRFAVPIVKEIALDVARECNLVELRDQSLRVVNNEPGSAVSDIMGDLAMFELYPQLAGKALQPFLEEVVKLLGDGKREGLLMDEGTEARGIERLDGWLEPLREGGSILQTDESPQGLPLGDLRQVLGTLNTLEYRLTHPGAQALFSALESSASQ